jgi:hypothetical protein
MKLVSPLIVASFACFLLASCTINKREALRILEHSPAESEIKHPLLRSDGYYYHIMDSNKYYLKHFNAKGKFRAWSYFISPEQLELILKTQVPEMGYYVVKSDTVIAKWIQKFDLGSYDIFEESFLVKDSTTIELVHRNIQIGGQRKQETTSFEYKFQKFDFKY